MTENGTKRYLQQKERGVDYSVNIDWSTRDNECLKLAQDAVKSILEKPGKLIRITREDTSREIAGNSWLIVAGLLRLRNI